MLCGDNIIKVFGHFRAYTQKCDIIFGFVSQVQCMVAHEL